MKFLSCAIGLLSVLLSCGVGEAGETVNVSDWSIISRNDDDFVQAGGKTTDNNWVPIKVDKEGYVIPSPCYQRMQEAMRKAYAHIEYRLGDTTVTPGVVMSEEKWKFFEAVMKECVR